MLTVVSFSICPFVQRVTATLEARNIPYNVEYISLKEKPDWFLQASPNGQVPLLISEQGTTLFESDAIIEFIQDEYGPLQLGLTNEQRAIERAWSYQAVKHYLPQCGAMSARDKVTYQKRLESLCKAFAKAESQLTGKTKFFSSNELGNIDLAWLPLLYRADLVQQFTQHDFLLNFPKISAWKDNLLETGLGGKSVPNDFIAKFKDFYLTNTYIAMGREKQDTACCSDSCCI